MFLENVDPILICMFSPVAGPFQRLKNSAIIYVTLSVLHWSVKSQEEALRSAVAVEAPAGSLVMFSGCLWHGAFRKQTPGLRVSMHGLHCAHYYLPQQDYKGRIPAAFYESSDDPDYLRMLMREDEPWLEAEINGTFKVPRTIASVAAD